jgi:hypothetical protein
MLFAIGLVAQDDTFTTGFAACVVTPAAMTVRYISKDMKVLREVVIPLR